MGLLAGLCLLTGPGCQQTSEPAALEATEVVARLRAHRLKGPQGESRPVLPPAGSVRVQRGKEGLTVAPEELARQGSRRGARVVLPEEARQPFHLKDTASGLSVDVALEGAAAARASVVDGYVVYPAAVTPEGGNLVYRFTPEGTEDYLTFERAPDVPRVRYGLKLGQGVAGLRLVGNTLEVLDGSGAPRLRMAPPYLVDAEGQVALADVSVEGCAVDTSPAAPWGRQVKAPGARQCHVRLEWSAGEVKYPAVLDPVWSATGSMLEGRTAFTLTPLQDGRVLAVAGDGSNVIPVASAELYDPATGTWAATGALASARKHHSATRLASGQVLVTGGQADTSVPSSSAELYDPATGTWSSAAAMNNARHLHTASRLLDGRVLVVGGQDANYNALLEAELYDPATDTWTLTSPLVMSRQEHGAEVLADGRVLVFGGGGSGTLTELYDPATGAWTQSGDMMNTRYRAVSARLLDGRVLVATGGGFEAELYDPATGTWSLTGALAQYRYDATASLLPDGRVLVLGGEYSGYGNSSGSTEVYDPATGTWSPGVMMLTGRTDPSSAVLLDGRVLVAGGKGGSPNPGPLASAELLLLDQDDVTAPTTTLTSPADGATVEGSAVYLTADALDDYGVKRVEFYTGDTLIGTATAAPYSVMWDTVLYANGTHTLTARAYDGANNMGTSTALTVTVNNDVTPPTVTLLSPVAGSTLQGSVTLSADASDDRSVDRVEFWLGRRQLTGVYVAPYTVTVSLSDVPGGPHLLRALAFDAYGNSGTSEEVPVTVVQPDTAAHDSTLQVPRCTQVGAACDSGSYLNGRAHLEPELNAPNTLHGTCADGTMGYHWDPSVDRIRVVSVDGGPLTAGKQARLEVTLTTWYSPGSQRLDLYSAADATHPVWTYLTTLTPASGSPQTRVTTVTLPSGTLQAVRARLRNGGTPAACGAGTYDDHDDLVFAVNLPAGLPSVAFTAPSAGATVSGTTTVSANASDDTGIQRVEFYVGTALLGSDTTAPYAVAWNTQSSLNGSHTLKAVAYDTAGNTSQSHVQVTVSNLGTSAVYDTTLGAPRCSQATASCDSSTLLLGRASLGPEANAPNTVDTCTDGIYGSYHGDESLDRLKVSTLDGSPLAVGKTVRIDATVWGYSSYLGDYLDLYYAPDAGAPAWVYVGSQQATASGSHVLSKTYTLPSGSARAVVRGVFRYSGSAGSCPGGAYTDVDDLVFQAL
jgi:hypothetical protein